MMHVESGQVRSIPSTSIYYTSCIMHHASILLSTYAIFIMYYCHHTLYIIVIIYVYDTTVLAHTECFIMELTSAETVLTWQESVNNKRKVRMERE